MAGRVCIDGAEKDSEEGTLMQRPGGQGEVGEVTPSEQHRETGWVSFRRDRGSECVCGGAG